MACPEKAIILGPCKVIPLEHPHIACRLIDVVVPEPVGWQQSDVDRLLYEITSSSADPVICYRKNQRWVPFFEPVRLSKPDQFPSCLQDGGTYLVTGGLGGIGLALAEFLARTFRAKLILTGRTALPPRETWPGWLESYPADDNISRKIRQVRMLEEQGAEVLVAAANVSNPAQMRSVIEHAKQRFGGIDGVIHAAGIAGGGIIALKTPEAAAAVLASKVKGTLVLHSLVKDLDLKFFLLCSSINSIVSAPAQVDYCAANAFQDAFAHHANSSKTTKFVSVNWDTWGEVGMAVDTVVPEAWKNARSDRLKAGIRSEEGVDAFCRVLSTAMPQLVVSTRDLRARFEAIEMMDSNTAEPQPSRSDQPLHHSRPELKNGFIAPRNETEQALVRIWQQLFGLDQVGVNDNFFDLGGHSLLAMQAIARIRSALEVNLPLNDLFEKPTVAGLAERIETMRWASRGITARNASAEERTEIEL